MTACCSSDTGNLFFHSRPRYETEAELFFFFPLINLLFVFIYLFIYLNFLYGPRLALAPSPSPRSPPVLLPADSTFRYIMLPFHEYLATKLLSPPAPPTARFPPLLLALRSLLPVGATSLVSVAFAVPSQRMNSPLPRPSRRRCRPTARALAFGSV